MFLFIIKYLFVCIYMYEYVCVLYIYIYLYVYSGNYWVSGLGDIFWIIVIWGKCI